MTKQEMVILIETAFQNVHLDGGISLRQAEVCDNRGEGVESKEEYKALPIHEITNDWQALSIETLDQYAYLAHMDAKGFRYYIPAFMRSVLVDYDYLSERVTFTLHSLYPKKDGLPKRDSLWEYSMSQYSLLNQEQRFAIAQYLYYLPTLIELDSGDEKITVRALRNYWEQYRVSPA